uniref:Tetraspanin n=1 Tax=Panagrellus redivivus TaxID=6233 RepID=A0A7E4VKJ3_PANRE
MVLMEVNICHGGSPVRRSVRSMRCHQSELSLQSNACPSINANLMPVGAMLTQSKSSTVTSELSLRPFADSFRPVKHSPERGKSQPEAIIGSRWHERQHLLPPMARIEYDRFESSVSLPRFRYDKKKVEKPRQEICAPLKWTCFMLNFVVFLAGVTALALGIYLCVKDPRPIQEWADFVLNPAILFIVIGLSVCIVSLIGLFGSLRDNVALLKAFALCVFLFYILIVMGASFLFILFYSDTSEGISAHSILLYSIKKYHTNRNIGDFVDYVQEQMECCGVSSMSQGFRDWQLSEQFNCNASNPYPEKCGVPFSCCRKTVISEAAGSANPLLPAMRSLQCWQNAQTKRVQDLETDIYVRGCLQPVRALFESHAVHLGVIVAVLFLPVCFWVCLSHLLARQIDYQRYLLEREARQFKRRQNRERHRLQQLEKKQQVMADQGFIPAQPAPPPTSTMPPGPPPHVNNSLPKKISNAGAEDRHQKRHKRRAISTSPLKAQNTGVSKNPNGNDMSTEKPGPPPKPHHHKKRRRSATNGPAQPTATGNEPSDFRTHQWVLQQSDLLGKK